MTIGVMGIGFDNMTKPDVTPKAAEMPEKKAYCLRTPRTSVNPCMMTAMRVCPVATQMDE